MLVIDKLLTGGIRFVLDKLMVAADQELNDDTALREQLLAAQMQVELGEMTQEEFAALEDRVLARIREIRARRGEPQGPIGFSSGEDDGSGEGEHRSLDVSDLSGIEASFVADDIHEELEPAAAPSAPAPVSRRKKARAPRRKK